MTGNQVLTVLAIICFSYACIRIGTTYIIAEKEKAIAHARFLAEQQREGLRQQKEGLQYKEWAEERDKLIQLIREETIELVASKRSFSE